MSDLALELGEHGADLVLEGVLAPPPPPVPDARDLDRRGWWGQDALEEVWGSRLWLADRSKVLAATSSSMETWAAEALEWITEEGIAEEVVVTTETQGSRIGLDVEIRRGTATLHPELWQATADLELDALTVRFLTG